MEYPEAAIGLRKRSVIYTWHAVSGMGEPPTVSEVVAAGDGAMREWVEAAPDDEADVEDHMGAALVRMSEAP